MCGYYDCTDCEVIYILEKSLISTRNLRSKRITGKEKVYKIPEFFKYDL